MVICRLEILQGLCSESQLIYKFLKLLQGNDSALPRGFTLVSGTLTSFLWSIKL